MHRASIMYKQRHFFHLLKTPNYIALSISPDDYDTTVNQKENTTALMLLLFLHFTEAASCICSLKKVINTCVQKTLPFFQWLRLLNIIKFIIKQLFAKNPFLKNTSAWLLLKSKFCSYKLRMLQKWSVKCLVSLKLWNNLSIVWINNFSTIWWTYNLISVPQITGLLLENAIISSKTKLSNGSRTEGEPKLCWS